MSDFTFLHSADIHLDSPLRGLERYEGAPVDEIRNATRIAFTNLVDLAIEKAVDFVIISGDLYDGNWRDYQTGLFFNKEMGRLREMEIPVYLISGNHDAESVLTKQLELPPNVSQFSSAKPETFLIEELKVALHGQSFANRAVPEDLSANYPQPVDSFFNIGILHTSAIGSPEHDTYAPCSIADLISKGYDYWALGHIHKREILHKNPWIVFPGNPQGRHIREQGAKGCTLVTVSDREILSVEAHELDVLRWLELEIDCSDVADFSDLSRKVIDALNEELKPAAGRTLAVRLILGETCPYHTEMSRNRERTINEIRAAALGHFSNAVWIEKVFFKTRPPIARNKELHDGTPAADFLQLLDQVGADEDEITQLIDSLSDLKRRIPPSLIANADDSDLFAPDWIRARIHEIKDDILPLLLQEND